MTGSPAPGGSMRRDGARPARWLVDRTHAGRAAVVRAREKLPEQLRSVRLRLALLYSLVLFGLAALVVGGLYVGVRSAVDEQPVSRQVATNKHILGADGRWRPVPVVLADYQDFERAVNQRTLEQLGRYSLGALGGLFLASIGVGWAISGHVVRPIDRITDVARDIQATDLTRRIALDGPQDEIKRLADTFDGMLGRLDVAFSSQRQFVADASHELRNPLATIRTNLDLVADADGLDAGPSAAPPGEHDRLVGAARRAAERMSRLVDDLLVLAREGTPLARRDDVDVGEAVRQLADEYEASASARAIRFVHRIEPGVVVAADAEAIKRAVANLLDNATRLAPESSQVVVGAGRQDGWAWLAVSDEGPGMSAEHAAHAFDRFWRADEARTRAGGGAGLGLAIVRQLVEAHGGRAHVHSAIDRGSIFVVWLPLPGHSGPPPGEPPAALSDRPGAHVTR